MGGGEEGIHKIGELGTLCQLWIWHMFWNWKGVRLEDGGAVPFTNHAANFAKRNRQIDLVKVFHNCTISGKIRLF